MEHLLEGVGLTLLIQSITIIGLDCLGLIKLKEFKEKKVDNKKEK